MPVMKTRKKENGKKRQHSFPEESKTLNILHLT